MRIEPWRHGEIGKSKGEAAVEGPQTKEVYLQLHKKLVKIVEELRPALTKDGRVARRKAANRVEFDKFKNAKAGMYEVLKQWLLWRPDANGSGKKASSNNVDETTTRHRAAAQLAKGKYKETSRTLEAVPRREVKTCEEELKKLYPEATTEYSFEIQPDKLKEIKVTKQEVLREIGGMARTESAPAWSGITANHLHRWCDKDAFLEAITWYVRDLLNGRLAKEHPLKEINRARGLPLNKENGGVRPIGINETVQNVAARVLLTKFSSKITAVLDAEQDMGFNKPGGSEAIVRALDALRRKADTNGQSMIILAIDFRNAFNSVLWDKMFALVKKRVPELLPFMTERYKDMVVEFKDGTGEAVLRMQRGVSQGCPLSPAIFQIVINEILAGARGTNPTMPCYAYLDDCTLVAHSLAEAATAYASIKHAAAEFGLEINEKKCELYIPNHCKDAGECCVKQLTMKETGLKDQKQFDAVIADFTQFKTSHDGIQLLGGCLGCDDFVDKWTKTEFSQIAKTIDRDCALFAFIHGKEYAAGKRQFAAHMLRYARFSLASRHTHIMRLVPSRWTTKHAWIIDAALAKAVLEIANPGRYHGGWEAPPELKIMLTLLEKENWRKFDEADDATTDEGRRQAVAKMAVERIFLPIGGLGINSVRNRNIGARLGSNALTAPTMHHANRTFFDDGKKLTYEDIDGIDDVNFWKKISDGQRIMADFALPKSPASLKSQAKVQRQINWGLTHKILPLGITKRLREIEKEATTKESDEQEYVARWTSVSTPEANAWLFPTQAQITYFLRDDVVKDNLLKMIGLGPFGPKHCMRQSCKADITSCRLRHAVSGACYRQGSGFAGKIIKTFFKWACREMGLNPSDYEPVLERGGAFTPKPNAAKDRRGKQGDSKAKVRRGDFLATVQARPIIFDASHTARAPRKQADQHVPGAAASEIEEDKIRFYKTEYEFREGDLLPLVVDVFGAWGKMTKEFFKTENEARKAQKMGSAWGKIKTVVSIGACQAYTARVDSVRQVYRETPSNTKDGED